ncbi:helix-hairpin-helix domain-containing protein [Salipaludibacillus sp. LMS25]|jgi:DNA uptake protein ComE-like DNA-binding protein|uniref:ComEA family DNA-binding protein n=1 Tax=Salipaludibacillus sp. LMS25 TaxID=2924031 RepID=UPI0020D03B70|nr:helix-hairpin-helix domain-containing protein [Salipaludibacillus sp. LMS25]UTR13184.1 helix-hairpin-helix domain-containing protein [Salipaludibacillus sp. LMS25]
MEKPSITQMGKKWELMNSLWMLWLFFIGFTSYISFFYIGARTNTKKWLIYGAIYGVLFAQGIIIDELASPESNLMTLSSLIFITSWIWSIVHGFLARPDYLRRKEKILLKEAALHEKQLRSIRTSTENDEIRAVPTPSSHHDHLTSDMNLLTDVSQPETSVGTERSVSKDIKAVKVNSATKQELTAIPSLNTFLAESIIAERGKNGAYESFEDFAERNSLKPHVVIKARPFLVFSESVENQPNSKMTTEEKKTTTKGRVIDF